MKYAPVAAFAAATLLAGVASAATLSGTFNVTAYNVTNLTSAESEATAANFDAAVGGTLGGSDSAIASDTFTYAGDLDFGTSSGTSTTVSSWLASGTPGGVTGLDASFGALQQSKGSIGNGSATSTFYVFELVAPLNASDFTIKHDDGVAVYEGDVDAANLVGGRVGPTAVKTTEVLGYAGPTFSLLYVATNSDPSILHVDSTATPVPLPAGLPLLAAGLGGLAFLRRKRATS